jgi:predicted pyridoxine 5'-phosphate oxidase superfamily flavin-nucleotide-binding protein
VTTFPESHRDLVDAQIAAFATLDRDGAVGTVPMSLRER